MAKDDKKKDTKDLTYIGSFPGISHDHESAAVVVEATPDGKEQVTNPDFNLSTGGDDALFSTDFPVQMSEGSADGIDLSPPETTKNLEIQLSDGIRGQDPSIETPPEATGTPSALSMDIANDLNEAQTGAFPDQKTDVKSKNPFMTPPDEFGVTLHSATPAQTTRPAFVMPAPQAPATPEAPKAVVAAAYPFSLLIEGALTLNEQLRLTDLLNRENMGIREIDLEPQFECDRVLIPRISEFAGVLLVQALRGTSAKLVFGPSDSIFSTIDTRATPEDRDAMSVATNEAEPVIAPQQEETEDDSTHPAEHLPITQEASLPGFGVIEILDVLTASTSLEAEALEAEGGGEYQLVVEALQRELKYKANRKGATAIVSFTVSAIPISFSKRYRISVTGTAVRAKKPATEADATSPALWS